MNNAERYWTLKEARQGDGNAKYYQNIIDILKPPRESTMLDIGCGMGKLAGQFCDYGLDVHGIDIASNCLNEEMYDLDVEEVEGEPRRHRDNFYFSDDNIIQPGARVAPSDYVICTDLLQQINEKQISTVLFHMKQLMIEAGFISIPLTLDLLSPNKLNVQLSVTIRGPQWWADQIGRFFKMSWAEDPITNHFISYIYHRKVPNGS